MFRCVLVASVVVLFAAPASAQLDAELKQPYLWRVVVSTKPHPLLTPEFRERVKRDVLAAIQPGLGNLGVAEVIDLTDLPRDRWDPLWQQFDDKGFAALDAPRDLSGVKTHFLRLEYRDGKFHLESRQHDGFTGLSSPLVRTQSTRAPELVGRTAGLMLDRDFGLTGTVEPITGPVKEAKVFIRGSGLGSVKDLVQVGDVFAVAAVRKTNREAPPPVRTATGKVLSPPAGSGPPTGLTATPRDFSLLKVKSVAPDGTCECVVLTRYKTLTPPDKGVIGLRCMKLGTIKAPVAVRLMSNDGTVYKTTSIATVRASDTGFALDKKDNPNEVCNVPPGSAVYCSQGELKNVACITVVVSNQRHLFPVPILNENPITLPVEISEETAERVAFERAVQTAAATAADARLAQSVCFQTVAKLIDQQKNSEALARAKGGHKAAEAAITGLTDEVSRLKEQVEKSPTAAKVLDTISQHLEALRKYNADLDGHIKILEQVAKQESNPGKALQAEEINSRIRLLLSRGDVDEALAAYNQLIALLSEPNDAETQREVIARRNKLAAEWKVKDAAHAKARDYLLKTWPVLATIPDLKDSLDQIRREVDLCKKQNDKWTLRKLLSIFDGAAVKLNELVNALDPASESDRKLLADAKAAGKVFGELELELREFVKE